MNDVPAAALPPGSVIGIMGGGQLGRMIAMAAYRLGYRCSVFCETENDPAAQVCDTVVAAPYDDFAALARFVTGTDVVTFEFENIPRESANWLTGHALVRPSARILEIAQDRALEKTFLNDNGIRTAPWVEISDEESLARAQEMIGQGAVFKTARFGYDGKGQAMLHSPQELSNAWDSVNRARAVVEGFIDFACEVSVIVARGPNGDIECFDIVENQHAHHILDVTISPARISPETTRKAAETGRGIAEALDLVGLVAVEMFVTREGDILVNEIAPRPHNSGHWTIDSCVTSQFEQMVRAVCGLPLGTPARHSNAIMRNLIGDDAHGWRKILESPETKLHLYGKSEARPGRKMGHMTRLFPKAGEWSPGEVETALKNWV
jgi:5-(carboxyamino)imidazole ribonucleotide synthase